ncbi:dihydrofolate reductase [Dietzia sp. SLG310A2-38A2]|uniref:dihydrofolate reductase family protein n=1 Tax=Dietzia sp. SLG310A2-38A2 TaxID=1630643 RepID=UPI0015F89020|nr:dihydrofolate reductase family protein [Dietzia sp. SLG310A2-38A2]MBB1030952.1 dihydrofolate reductase [Dietzia sp. SLG310A2-38A2]
MRKLIYYIAVTVDGFIADPDGRTDFFPFEGDHMAWLIEHYPETIPGHVRGAIGLAEAAPRVFDTVLLGRSTHQVAVDEGLASGYPHLRQYVVTHRPGDLPVEEGLTASDEDPVTLVRRLKVEDSPLNIWLCGGGNLAGALVDEIDEFRLKVNPVMIGRGRPLIAESAGALSLVAHRRIGFDSGVSYVEYARS